MRPSLFAATAIASLSIFYGQASALTFSFTANLGAQGTVSGLLEGLVDNQTSTPTNVIITAYPSWLDDAATSVYTTTIDTAGWTVIPDIGSSVTVSDGKIVSAYIDIADTGYPGANLVIYQDPVWAGISLFDMQLDGSNFGPQISVATFSGDPLVVFSAIPEPSPLTLLGSALAFLSLARRRMRQETVAVHENADLHN